VSAARAVLAVALLGLAATGAAQPPAPAEAPASAGQPSASTAALAQRVVGGPRGRALSGAALETATHELAGLLRCPVCQGLSVADSPTTLAQSMKRQARELLAAGYDREQVLAYFEASYGEFVRLQPPLRGVNWLVWLAPAAGLLIGGFVVARSVRRLRTATGRTTASSVSPEAVSDLDDPELRPYLLRVRELAYGWPGGVPPP
jgi:cytochrome c-type biogenesis protein CcmH